MRNKPSVFDCSIIDLGKISFEEGNLTVVENTNFPFIVKRVFYLYDIAGGESRGAHAHKECHQFLIAASGSYEVSLDDGNYKRQVFLNQPSFGLHIPPGVWASEINFSSGSICLVLASHEFNEFDYIRDYEVFKNSKEVVGKLTNLQPVNFKDAGFICELRNNPLNNNFLSTSNKIDIKQQINWINENKKTTDYYFMIKNINDISVGTISLYNLDKVSAEFGRYICQNSLNALEAVYLILKFAFDFLNLEYLYCKTVVENEKVWKQHLKFGFKFDRNEFNCSINKELVVQSISKETFENFDYTWLNNIIVKFSK